MRQLRLLIKQIWTSKDVASAVFLLAIAVTVGWIALLPFSAAVQETSLKRFHLATPNFATWAIQQPVPAMYNFENRYWASPQSLTAEELKQSEYQQARRGLSADPAGQRSAIETNVINHFPTRSFTFAFTRSYLENNPHQYFYLRSRYRGREIHSSFRTVPISKSEIRLERGECSLD